MSARTSHHHHLLVNYITLFYLRIGGRTHREIRNFTKMKNPILQKGSRGGEGVDGRASLHHHLDQGDYGITHIHHILGIIMVGTYHHHNLLISL